MTENYLKHLSTLVPQDELKQMRSLKELKPYLPWNVGGLVVSWEDTVQGDTAAGRMGSFLTLSNTPATQVMTRPFDPRDIAGLAERTIERDYDPELVEWEGSWQDILKPRGGRNPFHLLEQAIGMGPEGSPEKRGPAPIPWDIFYAAVDDLVEILRARIGDEKVVKAVVVATPGSSDETLQIAHVMSNSSGNPVFSDPSSGRTAKRYHIRYALNACSKFLRRTAQLPMWPFLVFARGDRAADFDLFLDCEESRDKAVFGKRDRKIDAQSFPLQLLDGIFTQRLANDIADGPVPEIDLREPTRLANHFEAGAGVVRDLGEDCFSIGRDESAWDQHVTPQGWYACYLIYRALFKSEQSVLVFQSDNALVVSQDDLNALADLADGKSRSVRLPAVRGEDTFPEDVVVTRHTFDADDVLRRMFAGASGTDAQMGNIRVTGYRHVLDTPRDGKIQLGWSMRSGNYCTFLGNSLINWHKTLCIDRMSKDDDVKAEFKQIFGYEPPAMSLRWLVVRGDDAGDVWEVPDRSREWKISELIADWLTYTGASANAKKQDASDVRGRWRLGFAQLFTNENFPRGVSSAVRVLERMVWNESDEVVTIDPDSGEDLRDVLLVMNTYGRLNNLWGVWSRDVHPRAKEVSALVQDLDSNRILPPLTEEERLKAARAWALKLLRRGQISASQLDNTLRHFWTTDLPQWALDRYDRTPKLQDKTWAPIKRYDNDARPHWRSC
jgi:hypothetical protein